MIDRYALHDKAEREAPLCPNTLLSFESWYLDIFVSIFHSISTAQHHISFDAFTGSLPTTPKNKLFAFKRIGNAKRCI